MSDILFRHLETRQPRHLLEFYEGYSIPTIYQGSKYSVLTARIRKRLLLSERLPPSWGHYRRCTTDVQFIIKEKEVRGVMNNRRMGVGRMQCDRRKKRHSSFIELSQPHWSHLKAQRSQMAPPQLRMVLPSNECSPARLNKQIISQLKLERDAQKFGRRYSTLLNPVHVNTNTEMNNSSTTNKENSPNKGNNIAPRKTTITRVGRENILEVQKSEIDIKREMLRKALNYIRNYSANLALCRPDAGRRMTIRNVLGTTASPPLKTRSLNKKTKIRHRTIEHPPSIGTGGTDTTEGDGDALLASIDSELNKIVTSNPFSYIQKPDPISTELSAIAISPKAILSIQKMKTPEEEEKVREDLLFGEEIYTYRARKRSFSFGDLGSLELPPIADEGELEGADDNRSSIHKKPDAEPQEYSRLLSGSNSSNYSNLFRQPSVNTDSERNEQNKQVEMKKEKYIYISSSSDKMRKADKYKANKPKLVSKFTKAYASADQNPKSSSTNFYQNIIQFSEELLKPVPDYKSHASGLQSAKSSEKEGETFTFSSKIVPYQKAMDEQNGGPMDRNLIEEEAMSQEDNSSSLSSKGSFRLYRKQSSLGRLQLSNQEATGNNLLLPCRKYSHIKSSRDNSISSPPDGKEFFNLSSCGSYPNGEESI